MKITSLLFAAIFFAGLIGWCMNIAGMMHMINDPTITPMLVARIVGIFFVPLGAVLGYV